MMNRYLKKGAGSRGSTGGTGYGGRSIIGPSNSSPSDDPKNHPVDQILGDISKGVTTCSGLANFCEHYLFVFLLSLSG
jgi:hypothetical protein